MVEGLGLFKDHFKDHTDHYILIGGSACDWQLEKKGFDFRATKDLDIILVAEALSADFVRRFWQFVTPGDPIDTPPPIKVDIQQYIGIIRKEDPDVRQILRSGNISIEQIIELLVQTFGLEN